MRFENFTSLPDFLLREIIRFACPSGVSGFDIAFKNTSGGFHGRAYTQGCAYHEQSQRRKSGRRRAKAVPYVVINCPTIKRYVRPRVTNIGGGYLYSEQYSYEEDVVHLAAHELRHLWQKRVKSGHRVWGARGQYSERDADAYAIAKTREWRRLHGIRQTPGQAPRRACTLDGITITARKRTR